MYAAFRPQPLLPTGPSSDRTGPDMTSEGGDSVSHGRGRHLRRKGRGAPCPKAAAAFVLRWEHRTGRSASYGASRLTGQGIKELPAADNFLCNRNHLISLRFQLHLLSSGRAEAGAKSLRSQWTGRNSQSTSASHLAVTRVSPGCDQGRLRISSTFVWAREGAS